METGAIFAALDGNFEPYSPPDSPFIDRQDLEKHLEIELKKACEILVRQTGCTADEDEPQDIFDVIQSASLRTYEIQKSAPKPAIPVRHRPNKSDTPRKLSDIAAAIIPTKREKRAASTSNTELTEPFFSARADSLRARLLPSNHSRKTQLNTKPIAEEAVKSSSEPHSGIQFAHNSALDDLLSTNSLAAAQADIKAREWMNQQKQKNDEENHVVRGKSRSGTTDSASSFASNFKDFIRGRSRSRSRESSIPHSRSESQSGLSSAWRNLRRKASVGNMSSAVATRADVKPGLWKQKSTGDLRNSVKPPVNLNRELPPLPPLDTYDFPDVPDSIPKIDGAVAELPTSKSPISASNDDQIITIELDTSTPATRLSSQAFPMPSMDVDATEVTELSAAPTSRRASVRSLKRSTKNSFNSSQSSCFTATSPNSPLTPFETRQRSIEFIKAASAAAASNKVPSASASKSPKYSTDMSNPSTTKTSVSSPTVKSPKLSLSACSPPPTIKSPSASAQTSHGSAKVLTPARYTLVHPAVRGNSLAANIIASSDMSKTATIASTITPSISTSKPNPMSIKITDNKSPPKDSDMQLPDIEAGIHNVSTFSPFLPAIEPTTALTISLSPQSPRASEFPKPATTTAVPINATSIIVANTTTTPSASHAQPTVSRNLPASTAKNPPKSLDSKPAHILKLSLPQSEKATPATTNGPTLKHKYSTESDDTPTSRRSHVSSSAASISHLSTVGDGSSTIAAIDTTAWKRPTIHSPTVAYNEQRGSLPLHDIPRKRPATAGATRSATASKGFVIGEITKDDDDNTIVTALPPMPNQRKGIRRMFSSIGGSGSGRNGPLGIGLKI